MLRGFQRFCTGRSMPSSANLVHSAVFALVASCFLSLSGATATAQTVYMTTPSAIKKATFASGAWFVSDVPVAVNNPRSLCIDGGCTGKLYWLEGNQIRSCNTDGTGPATILYSGGGYTPEYLAVHDMRGELVIGSNRSTGPPYFDSQAKIFTIDFAAPELTVLILDLGLARLTSLSVSPTTDLLRYSYQSPSRVCGIDLKCGCCTYTPTTAVASRTFGNSVNTILTQESASCCCDRLFHGVVSDDMGPAFFYHAWRGSEVGGIGNCPPQLPANAVYDGSNQLLLLTTNCYPNYSVLAASAGKVYWVEVDPQPPYPACLRRTNYNGTDATTIVSGLTITSVAVDNSADSDGDGIPDLYETFGIDLTGDGIVNAEDGDFNLPGMGANPNKMDIFVEVDSMAAAMLQPGSLDLVTTAFANATVENPDSSLGIAVHINIDDTYLPSESWYLDAFEMPYQFREYKNAYFGTAQEREIPNWSTLRNVKERYFHYCMIIEAANTGKVGVAELPGNDLIIRQAGGECSSDPRRLAARFMHELGHNLGLKHTGDQPQYSSYDYKPNYPSVMNKLWSEPYCLENIACPMPPAICDFRRLLLEQHASSWVLNYSYGTLGPIDERFLCEPCGLCGRPGAVTLLGPLGGSDTLTCFPGSPIQAFRINRLQLAPEAAPIELTGDCPEHISGICVVPCGGCTEGRQRDLNRFSVLPSPDRYTILKDHDDWGSLVFKQCREAFTPGVSHATNLSSEISVEELVELWGDCNHNGMRDEFEIWEVPDRDCNRNGVLDVCDPFGQVTLPWYDELTDNVPVTWGAAAQSASASVTRDIARVRHGCSSVKFDTTGGFDTWLWSPEARNADWDLTGVQYLWMEVYTENPNAPGFQSNSPWIRFGSAAGYIQLQPNAEVLNTTRNNWIPFAIPVAGDIIWQRTQVGTVDLAHINYIEIHMDTWGFGFTAWLDAISFLSENDISSAQISESVGSGYLGFPVKLRVEGGLTNAYTIDPLPFVTGWSSEDLSTVAIEGSNTARGLQVGSAIIHATLGGSDLTAPFSVLPLPATLSTDRVSLDSNGTEANAASDIPAISGNGRVVAFRSNASNLVPGDTNGVRDDFVRDLRSGMTTRVSVSTGGGEANGVSSSPEISFDGRYVAFFSTASNLVASDTNGVSDAFVHDRQLNQTMRVSVSTGGAQDNASVPAGNRAAISADGRFVAFDSFGSNLVFGDTNNRQDVFVRDRQNNTTTRVSVSSSGIEGNDNSGAQSISSDGRWIVFVSNATNLVAGDSNGKADVFLHDRQTGVTTRVNVSSAGQESNNDSTISRRPISADGRFIAFHSNATNLVAGDVNGVQDLFLRDVQAGTTIRVNVAPGGDEDNGGIILGATSTMSADGRSIAFSSFGNNLVASDTNGVEDVFIFNRLSGQLVRESANFVGEQANNLSSPTGLSADSRYLVYHSDATNLAPFDLNGVRDVFLRIRAIDGDLNCDGQVTIFDIPEFVQVLLDPVGYELLHPSCFVSTADMNGDGSVDGMDIQGFIDALTSM